LAICSRLPATAKPVILCTSSGVIETGKSDNTLLQELWPPRLISKTGYAVLFVALLPDVEKRPRYPEEAASLADITAHALRMLQHAQPGLHFPRLHLFVDLVFYPEPPVVGFEGTSPVLDVY
jgi:hypothetical protein